MTRNKKVVILILSAVAIIAVNGMAMLFCKYADKNNAAQRYYSEFEPIKYYLFVFCYSIIAMSLTFNIRFLIILMTEKIKKHLFN